jgi:hypothetical protein
MPGRAKSIPASRVIDPIVKVCALSCRARLLPSPFPRKGFQRKTSRACTGGFTADFRDNASNLSGRLPILFPGTSGEEWPLRRKRFRMGEACQQTRIYGWSLALPFFFLDGANRLHKEPRTK